MVPMLYAGYLQIKYISFRKGRGTVFKADSRWGFSVSKTEDLAVPKTVIISEIGSKNQIDLE